MSVVRRLGSLARHAFLFEAAIYVSLWRWVSRRPDLPKDATPLAYGRLVTPILWLFVWGSAIEVVAVDLVVHHFGWVLVRVPLLVVGVWSLMWMLGLLAAIRTRPHVRTETGLRLRAGLRSEVVVPLGAVSELLSREHELSSSMRNIEVVDGRLLVGVSGRTNVVMTLAAPTPLQTPKGEVTVQQVAFWVDEPRDAVAMLRQRDRTR